MALCFVRRGAAVGERSRRIGFVASTSPNDRDLQAFRQGLVDLGYIDGKNILVEYRHAQGKNERLPELTSELLQTKVDILISSSSPAILAAKKESRTTPIIMITTVDPVATSLIRACPPRWKRYRSHTPHARPKWETLGTFKGSRSGIIARRHPGEYDYFSRNPRTE